MTFLFHGCFQSFHQHCFFPVDVQSSTAQFFLELWDGSLGQVFHLRLLRVWMVFLPSWHVVITCTRVWCLLRSSSSSELPSPPMPRTKIQHERTREETYEFLLTMAPGASIPPDERKNSPRRILLHETGLDGKACACVGENRDYKRGTREEWHWILPSFVCIDVVDWILLHPSVTVPLPSKRERTTNQCPWCPCGWCHVSTCQPHIHPIPKQDIASIPTKDKPSMKKGETPTYRPTVCKR